MPRHPMNLAHSVRALLHLWEHPAHQQLLALEAATQLLALKAMLILIPFKHWHKLLHSPVAGQTHLTDDPRVEQIVWAVERVSAQFPEELTCLPRALAARSLLERRKIACQLRIGVRRNAQGQLEAHAWLEYQGKIILGDLPNLAEFVELTSGADPN